jgi:hypothetical protein
MEQAPLSITVPEVGLEIEQAVSVGRKLVPLTTI